MPTSSSWAPWASTGRRRSTYPEGFFDVEFRGRKARLPFPRQAGSWYHWSKVHGSNNVMFACQLLGLRATDIMQGVVLGCRTAEIGEDPERATRLDFDEAFGTIVNRMCCQAVIGHPLTLYGEGHQKRGFIPLTESIECMRLAIESPPAAGEYRVFNQFDLVLDLTDLAGMIQSVGRDLGLEVRICHLENPRRELEDHRYQPDREGLLQARFLADRRRRRRDPFDARRPDPLPRSRRAEGRTDDPEREMGRTPATRLGPGRSIGRLTQLRLQPTRPGRRS